MRDRPTPAEAMALWYSLGRPSGTEVAARFTAAGRPISYRTITRWKKSGWQGVANAPRTDRPTPAEAQAIWDSLEQPTLQKVADAFKAQGRPVSHSTIWNWQQAGWSDITAQNAVRKANRAVEKIAAALPALTGDARSTLSDFLRGNEVVPDQHGDDQRNDDKRRNDTRSKAEIIEATLMEAMRTARAVNAAIHEVAAAVPKADVFAAQDAALPMLLQEPDGIAKLMMASNAGISVTIGGIRQLPVLRAEAAAEIPGTHTVYPPDREHPAAWEARSEIGELMRRAEAARANGDAPDPQDVRRLDEILQEADEEAGGEKGYPLRSSMLAYDRELKAIMMGKYDKR